MRIIGVDPGVNGAIAWIDGHEAHLQVLRFPTVKSAGGKNELNLHAIDNWIQVQLLAGDVDAAYVEQVSAMPKQGVASTFKFGFAAGAVRGLLVAHRIPIVPVTPAKWKKAMGLNNEKDYSRKMAIELFPHYAHLFALKKNADEAEAALLAMHGLNEKTSKEK